MSTRFVFRVTAPLLGVSLLLLGLGAFTAWYVHSMQQQSTDLISKSIATSNASQSLENELRELSTNLNEFVITGNAEYLEFAKRATEKVEDLLNTTEALSYLYDGEPKLVEIRREFVAFEQQFAKIIRPTTQEQQNAVLRLIQTSISKELIPRATQHREAQQARLEEMSQSSELIADRVSLTLLLLVTFGAIGGLTAGIAVARKVHQSIIELNIPVHAASGMLNEVVGPLKISTQCNLTEIRESLDEMANRVGLTVQRLQESQKKMLRAEQLAALSQMAAGLAHEIRNPLTAMRSLVQMARQQGGGAALDNRDIEVLDTEIERLNELVQTFLDFARPPRLSRRLANISHIILRTVQLTKRRAERQEVQIDFDPPLSDIILNADPQQIQQVLLNLVLNAIDAQPNGGKVWIRLRSTARLTEEDWVEVLVGDAGPGIDSKWIDRIFDPFFSTKETGTGIGLAICRRIVEEHEGNITAENLQQGGAMFTVLLPSGQCMAIEGTSPSTLVV